MPILLNPSTLTGTNAKIKVARVIGAQTDADWLAVAADCIAEALREWETAHDWAWLYVTGADITLLADTSVYNLPALFRKPYSARIGNTYLAYVPQRFWDMVNSGATTSGRSVMGYTMFNASDTGKIELIPAIGADPGTEKLKVRFWRKINDTIDGTAIDIPEMYEDGIIARARQLILMEKGGDDVRLEMFKRSADKWLDRARADDRRLPDSDEGLYPLSALAGTTAFNPNSISLIQGYWDYD